jgi:hypothetical protein
MVSKICIRARHLRGTPEKRLLILYGADSPPRVLPKAELLDIITWFYKQLYAANMFADAEDDRQYQDYLDQLC